MKVHYGFDEIGTINNPVITTGSFDGVHLGHKTIINRINEIARSIDGESVLITFYPHPRKVLYPETVGKDLKFLLSQREKIDLLSKTGLNHLIIVKFTLEFSKISSIDFIKKYLVNKLHAKFIVAGFNHHFGHNREGGFDELHRLSKQFSFNVEEIPEQDIHQEAVNSTTIRKAIIDGDIQLANEFLDHQYIIIGALGRGTHFFKQVGFPTLTVQVEEVGKLIPPNGIYSVSLDWNSAVYKAILIIWSNNSHFVDSSEKFIEVHILDFNKKICCDDTKLFFHRQLDSNVDVSDLQQLKYKLNEALKLLN